MQLFHTGATGAALITAALHGHRQVIGAAEGGHEQRNENGNQRLNPLEQAARLHIRAACLLGGHNLVGFLHQGRNKPQSDGHHHRQLVGVDPNQLQRRQQTLDGVGQRRGGGGIGEQRATQNQANNTDGDKRRRLQAAGGDKSTRPQRGAVVHVQDIENRGEQHQEQHRLGATPHQANGQTGQAQHQHQKQTHRQQSPPVLRQEHQHDKAKGQHQLHARVDAVQERITGEILTQRNVFHHTASPPNRERI